MKKIIASIICLMLVFSLSGCAIKPAEKADGEEVGGDICPCIMVNGEVYFDTGYKSSVDGRCGNFDGEITSECPASELPTEDGQSNFGKGYGYQYGAVEGSVEVKLSDGNWYIFATEEVKASYKPR